MGTGSRRDQIAGDGVKSKSAPSRLYQRLARMLLDDVSSGKYTVGDRLPAERELSAEYGVSRPAVREALIALEVQGFVEVRVGAGAFVRRVPGKDDNPGFAITAFELTEARMIFEGEAAWQAALYITDEELRELDALVDRIAEENRHAEVSEEADRAFHLAIASATRNAAILLTIEQFWQLRSTSPESALLHDKARHAKVRPVVEEHRAIARALRQRDPAQARAAMRDHLSAVMEHLLFATEAKAIEEAKRTVASTRARYIRGHIPAR
jgi:GntR family transcriptional repressor for pyruvate dehydrogenase complex